MQAIAESRGVNWYYANNGQQHGPVPELELESLALRGVIAPGTLVWREGMAQWQPYSVIRQPAPMVSPAPAIALPPIIHQQQCVECQRFFAKDDLLRYENIFVCAMCKPAFFQKLREGVAPGILGGLWRSGKLLVMRKQALLPDRCVKCNQPANGFRLRRNLSWHSPWLFLLLVVAWLVYIIVAAVTSKKARIEIGLCEEHRRIRSRDLLIAWLAVAAALGSFVMAGIFNPGWPYALTGTVLLLGAIIYGVARVPQVQPKRIDDQFVWLNGVAPEYLADLNEFTGQS
jgi:hypothetical protein